MVDAINDYADSGYLTPATLLSRRKLAQDMLEAGMQTTPISSHWQGLARLAQAGLGGFNMGSLDAQERQQGKRDSALMASLFGGGTAPAASPTSSMPAAPAAAAPALSLPGPASASPAGGSLAASGAGDMDRWSAGISNNESGGDYGKLGPVTKTGDRAYGKYQVMGENIPAWTKEALGQGMTPEQFLANKDAQDKVFRTKFGQYAQKYGPEGAAKAWFAGEGGMNNPGAKDQLGTTVAGYADKFNAGAGISPPASSAPVPAQAAPGNTISPMPGGGNSQRLQAAIQLSMSGDPRKAALGNAIVNTFLKTDTEIPPALKEYGFAQRQAAASGETIPSFSEWQKDQKRAGAQQTSINMGDNKLKAALGEGLGKQLIEGRQAAQDAVLSLQSNAEAKKLLDSGIITGAGANIKLTLGKALQTIGVNMSDDPISNSEAYISSRALETGRLIKNFGSGTGLSDADREYAMKAAGGSISLNETSIRKILDINERASRNLIARHNASVDKLPPGYLDYDMHVAPPEAAPSRPQSTLSPAAPKVGEMRRGYRFKGGDPSQEQSWEQVQ